MSNRSDLVPLLDLNAKEKIDVEEIKDDSIPIDEDDVDLDEIQQGAFTEPLYDPVRFLDQFLEKVDEKSDLNKVSEKVHIEPLETIPLISLYEETRFDYIDEEEIPL